VSHALARIRQAAKLRKKERFTSLLHHVSVDLLRLSFFALKKDAAPGVDGLAWRDYETNLEDNLEDLHDRVHRGAYRALPSRRQYIPKADGRQRPIAICALEDKIVQRAVAVVLNAIYEEDFLGFSYGFRPKRNQLLLALEKRVKLTAAALRAGRRVDPDTDEFAARWGFSRHGQSTVMTPKEKNAG